MTVPSISYIGTDPSKLQHSGQMAFDVANDQIQISALGSSLIDITTSNGSNLIMGSNGEWKSITDTTNEKLHNINFNTVIMLSTIISILKKSNLLNDKDLESIIKRSYQYAKNLQKEDKFPDNITERVVLCENLGIPKIMDEILAQIIKCGKVEEIIS